MKKFEQIDISGDVGLRVYGKSLKEFFENAATGMFSLITDLSDITETEKREIILQADNYEESFIKWLNELLFLFDAYGFTGKTFKLVIQDNILKAEVSGGIFNPETNEKKPLIKAATYHKLSVSAIGSHWESTVIFDI